MKRSMLAALALSLGLCTSAFAQVTGKVTFDGKAPDRAKLVAAMNDPNCKALHKEAPLDERVIVGKAGELANAVVYLKGDLKGDVPADEVVLDQVNCIYSPHVVSVTVGQKLVAQNSDAFLHNVNVQSENTPKNVAQPVKGQKDTIGTKASEYFKVVCNVHPWMSAWVAVFDHPFHSVTIDDGTFEIPTKGLKDGEYDIAVWHERFKDNCATGKVTIKGGKGTVDLVVKPKAAAADQAPERTVMVSTGAAKPTCCTDGSKCAETAAKKAAEEKAAAEKAKAGQLQAAAK